MRIVKYISFPEIFNIYAILIIGYICRYNRSISQRFRDNSVSSGCHWNSWFETRSLISPLLICTSCICCSRIVTTAIFSRNRFHSGAARRYAVYGGRRWFRDRRRRRLQISDPHAARRCKARFSATAVTLNRENERPQARTPADGNEIRVRDEGTNLI